MVVLVAVALAVPWVLGVRDWRCYGLLLLWPPVIWSIQTGNVTLWFALAAAIAWRLRDRPFGSSASIGLMLAANSSSGRHRLAAATNGCSARGRVRRRRRCPDALLGVIGFAGMADYPQLLRRLDLRSATTRTRCTSSGSTSGSLAVARALWLDSGCSLWRVVVLGVVGTSGRHSSSQSRRRSGRRRSCGCTTSRSCSSSSLLRSRGRLCLVPASGHVHHAGSGHPSPFDTAWALVSRR